MVSQPMVTHQTREHTKHTSELLPGLARGKWRSLGSFVRARRAHLHRFHDDGDTPNNSLPLVHYRSPFRLDDVADPAAIFEHVFAANGWRHSWRDGVYPYNHFHTRTHEVLGVARGSVCVRFGGRAGRDIELRAGDAVIIPAGVGHRRRKGAPDLLVVGAYPVYGAYDEPRPAEIDIEKARLCIKRVKQPFSDPIYGKNGPLLEAWRGGDA